MKPTKLIIIILVLFLTIIIARSSQDDYDIEFEVPYIFNTSILFFTKEDWLDSIYEIMNDNSYLTESERDIIFKYNKWHTNPSRYANEYLIPFLNSMNDDGTYILTL